MTARPQIRDNSVLACQDSDPKHNDSTSDKGARAAAPPEAQVFPDARTGAVWLARRGLPVFRTNLQTLTPKCPQFWEKASADPAQVACDFTDATGESVADNVAVSTGKSIVVVDADVKKGQPGLASLARLDAQGLPRETLTIRTPSGGLHRYYRVDPARVYRNRQDWRPGVDIRGHHGYANAPGSVKPDGSTYTIELDAPIADLPEAFANELACGHAASDAPAIETDKYEDDWSIGEAIRFLPTAEPDAGPGNHHDPLIRIGHVLFDFGITTRRAVELIEDHWPQAPAVSDVLEYQIERLAAGRKEPWGAKHPRARPSVYDTFERAYLANPADEHPRFAANSNGEGRRVTELPVVRACDLAGKPVPPRRWLVREMIPDSDVTLLFGDGGTGKSMLALQLAVATVAGKEWLGNLPEKGPVILVSAEDDLDEMHRRLAADVARLGIDLADLPDLHLVSLAGHDAGEQVRGNRSYGALAEACRARRTDRAAPGRSRHARRRLCRRRKRASRSAPVHRYVARTGDRARPIRRLARSPLVVRHGERVRHKRLDGMEQFRPLAAVSGADQE